jgi:hypothetical protein
MRKAIRLSQEDREAAGLGSPSPQASKEQLLCDSEKRSKSNHDRPSRRLMLEATMAVDASVVDQNSPASTLGLHQAFAIAHNTTVRQLLLEDSPIPALGATVARAPCSKAAPARAERKSTRGMGLTDGPVLERAVRIAADKNDTTKSLANKTATTTSSPQILGTSPIAEFTAFQDSSVEHLLHVAKDSCILFKSVDKTPAQLVALIQAKELAQAELAAARQKVEEEPAKNKAEEAATKKADEAEKGPTETAPPCEVPRGDLAPEKEAPRRSPIRSKRRRAASRPNPIGTHPLTRRARAMQLVSQ